MNEYEAYRGDQIRDDAYMSWIENHPEYSKNLETAKAFLEQHTTPERVQDALNGIDFTKPVETGFLEPGHPLQRSEFVPNPEMNDRRPERADGCWFADVGTPEKELGIIDVYSGTPHVERERDLFSIRETDPETKEAQKPIEVLKSVARDFGDVVRNPDRPDRSFNPAGLLLRGGETQYYIPYANLDAVERVIHPSRGVQHDSVPMAEQKADREPSGNAEMMDSRQAEMKRAVEEAIQKAIEKTIEQERQPDREPRR